MPRISKENNNALTSHKESDLNKILARGYFITRAALNRGLFFRPTTDLALISGAGIAGLAASFELIAKGFKVIIAEKRGSFDRFNVINLDVETQRFLKKFGLLQEFEASVSARIKEHNIVRYDKDGFRLLDCTTVSELQPSDVPFEPEYVNQLFNQEGIYSVKIKDLQTFLAKKALDAGVRLFGDVEVDILGYTALGGVSDIQVKGKEALSDPIRLKPTLFFVAEGAHSATAKTLGMDSVVVENECSDENWIFGNLRYSGEETFVISMVDASEDELGIANIIVNAKNREINIAVTSNSDLSQKQIEERILMIANRVFPFGHINDVPELISTVKHPVYVNNEQRLKYSQDNVFCIGDASGHSSPLAGMGGTLGLTLVPHAVEALIGDRARRPQMMHTAFNLHSQAYTSRWIEKSQKVKKLCIDAAGLRSKPRCK